MGKIKNWSWSIGLCTFGFYMNFNILLNKSVSSTLTLWCEFDKLYTLKSWFYTSNSHSQKMSLWIHSVLVSPRTGDKFWVHRWRIVYPIFNPWTLSMFLVTDFFFHLHNAFTQEVLFPYIGSFTQMLTFYFSRIAGYQ